MRFLNDKIRQIFESIIWLIIIGATLYVVTQFSWDKAEQFLTYILVFGTLASVYFYLSNRSLFAESKKKTKELLEKQKELKSRQKTIDLIFENSDDGIMVLDDEKRIETFSPGMEKITGYKSHEAIGRLAQNLLKFSAEKNTSLLPDLMFTSTKLKKDKPYINNSIMSKEGKQISVEASYTMIQGTSGNKPKALAVLRDVTYEQALVERDKEFIAVTSHQLNTPLSIIRGYSSLLIGEKAGKLNTKQKEYLSQVKESVLKMIDLTNNLLSISRIEQDKIKLKIGDVNLCQVTSDIVKEMQPKAEENEIGLVCKTKNKNLIIQADQDKLSQALSNIVDNAIKYTKKGSVTGEIIDNKSSVTIIIKDTGIGIPKEELEKIGEKFYRSQNAIDEDNQGTGLGVFIAKTIIEKHAGSLEIESKIGKGTIIKITLPKNQPLTDTLTYKEKQNG